MFHFLFIGFGLTMGIGLAILLLISIVNMNERRKAHRAARRAVPRKPPSLRWPAYSLLFAACFSITGYIQISSDEAPGYLLQPTVVLFILSALFLELIRLGYKHYRRHHQ